MSLVTTLSWFKWVFSNHSCGNMAGLVPARAVPIARTYVREISTAHACAWLTDAGIVGWELALSCSCPDPPLWWPGITQQIDNIVKECPTCKRNATPNSEPMIKTELPDFPWQQVGSDLLVLNGVSYLLIVDYFSRFVEIVKYEDHYVS